MERGFVVVLDELMTEYLFGLAVQVDLPVKIMAVARVFQDLLLSCRRQRESPPSLD